MDALCRDLTFLETNSVSGTTFKCYEKMMMVFLGWIEALPTVVTRKDKL